MRSNFIQNMSKIERKTKTNQIPQSPSNPFIMSSETSSPTVGPKTASSSSTSTKRTGPSKKSQSKASAQPDPTATSSVTSPSGQDSSSAAASSSSSVKKVRRQRFDPYIPNSYLNLQELWNYRNSQRQNLTKMRNRLSQFANHSGKEYEEALSKGQVVDRQKKMEDYILRVERLLNLVDEGRREVVEDTRLLVDLSRQGSVKVDPVTLNMLSSTLSSSLGATTSSQPNTGSVDQ